MRGGEQQLMFSCAGSSLGAGAPHRRLWAPAFAGARSSADERGFTLIELLVALTIFAMLAAAGVMLLGNTVSAQGQISAHMEEQGGMVRVIALIDQDMREAVPRISRTESGTLAPVFFSRAPSDDQPFLQFVRGGWSNLDDKPRPDLQKVEYWLRGGKLERRTYGQVDGAAGGDPAMLVEGVKALGFAFRDAQGEWIDQWQQPGPMAMPRAMRLMIDREGQPPLTLMFRVGSGQPAEQQRQANADG